MQLKNEKHKIYYLTFLLLMEEIKTNRFISSW